MPEGVSEQAMGEAAVASAKAIDSAWGNPGRPEWADGAQVDYARMVLEAALPVLLESGELVSGDDHRAVLADAVEDATAGIDAAQRAEERAVRAERALADCKDRLYRVEDFVNRTTKWTGTDEGEQADALADVRDCLARLGSDE